MKVIRDGVRENEQEMQDSWSFFHFKLVIPAKAGIQKCFVWMPAWRGHDHKTPRTARII